MSKGVGPAGKFLAASLLVALLLAVGMHYLRVRDENASAPDWQEHVGEVKALKARMESLLLRMSKAVGEGKCAVDNDCRILGVGAKLCGKFDKYLLYSTAEADESEVRGLVTEYNAYAEQLNKISYKVLGCGIEAKPVRCLQRRCVPAL